MEILTISAVTLRRFILGQQGLWPGRRWRGKAGVAAALRSGSVVQIDPLNVIARSHDTSLYSRVLDYQPRQLDELLYTDRVAFDYGGTVFIHLMEQLPYWRVVMERNRCHGRWAAFAELNPQVIDDVRTEISARGPLGGRDFKGNNVGRGNYRGSKDTGLALYYLWFSGELMTAGRRFGTSSANTSGGSFDRLYDLRERVAPTKFNRAATSDEADAFFSIETFRKMGILDARGFRNWFSGMIQRKVGEGEAAERLAALQAAGTIVPIGMAGEPKDRRYILAVELAHLEALQADRVPEDWQPIAAHTSLEAVVLAPLEIVSARGRARLLFDFDYVWEVYKPVELRRWGYYTLPILYGDRLAARFDSRLERAAGTLRILGFWLEDWVHVDESFRAALAAGFRRFMTFTGAEQLECAPGLSAETKCLFEMF